MIDVFQIKPVTMRLKCYQRKTVIYVTLDLQSVKPSTNKSIFVKHSLLFTPGDFFYLALLYIRKI